MDFVKKATGTIFHVTNESLIPFYERDERFEKLEGKKEAPKKATQKKETK